MIRSTFTIKIVSKVETPNPICQVSGTGNDATLIKIEINLWPIWSALGYRPSY